MTQHVRYRAYGQLLASLNVLVDVDEADVSPQWQRYIMYVCAYPGLHVARGGGGKGGRGVAGEVYLEYNGLFELLC